MKLLDRIHSMLSQEAERWGGVVGVVEDAQVLREIAKKVAASIRAAGERHYYCECDTPGLHENPAACRREGRCRWVLVLDR